MTRDLSKHPIREPHPWGEHRTWCSQCGEPAWVDDVAFHLWHAGSPFTSAGVGCTKPRPGPLRRILTRVGAR